MFASNLLFLYQFAFFYRGYLSPVGEASGSSYEALGQQGIVHLYSTMQNRDLLGHGSNYEAIGQGTVHVYSTMQNREIN